MEQNLQSYGYQYKGKLDLYDVLKVKFYTIVSHECSY